MDYFNMRIGANSEGLGTINISRLSFEANPEDGSYLIQFPIFADWTSTSDYWMPMYFGVTGLHIWVRQPTPSMTLVEDYILYSYIDETTQESINCLTTQPYLTIEDGIIYIELPPNTLWNPDAVQSAAAPGDQPEMDPVPESVAVQQTANWRTLNLLGTIKAMYIPIQDILNILANPNLPKVVGLRAYFAVIDATKPVGPGNVHLYMVPAEEGDDINPYIDILTDPKTGESLIYDTTMPCPHICSTVNPLNPLTQFEKKKLKLAQLQHAE